MTSYLDIARQALSQGAGITNTKKAKDTKKPSRANSLISSNSCSYYSSGSTQRPIASDADAAWRAEDWQAIFEERAAIIEFDAKLSREQAEARALAWCVAEWLTPTPSDQRPTAVSAAVRATDRSIRCCRSALRLPAMSGSMLIAGQHGMQAGGRGPYGPDGNGYPAPSTARSARHIEPLGRSE
jgi:hypothetical protein